MSFRNGSVEEGAKGSPCCCSLLLGIFFLAEQNKAVAQLAQVTVPGQAWRCSSDSRRKQDRSIWLRAISKSMVNRHCVSLLSCFRRHRLVAWTMASQPFSVSKLQLSRVEIACHVEAVCLLLSTEGLEPTRCDCRCEPCWQSKTRSCCCEWERRRGIG